jgi:outer membrane biosynthesis protein TonB
VNDKIFQTALFGSLLVHSFFLVGTPGLLPRPAAAKTKPIEVVYQGHQKPPESQRERIQRVQALTEEKTVRSSPQGLKIPGETEAVMLKDMGQHRERIAVPDKQPLKVVNLSEKRHVSVPLLATRKITNPKYINYNDRIREKIRNRAYFYIDDPKFESGEVYLTFVLLADGSLKDLQIIGAKSRANDYLRGVGLRSIKESHPFPAFPGDLNYPELSFNVIISFEVSDKQ